MVTLQNGRRRPTAWMVSLAVVAALAFPAFLHGQPADDLFRQKVETLAVRPGSYRTPLIADGKVMAVIVASADAGHQALAARLAQAIAAKTGVTLAVRKDTDVVKGRGRGPKDEYAKAPLILLGDINSNEAIIPLYARFLCFADAEYPGPGGYALRTIRNPWGTLANVILVAASDMDGLQKGVAALLAAPELKCRQNQAACDFLLTLKPVFTPEIQQKIKRAGACAADFAAAAEKDPAHKFAFEMGGSYAYDQPGANTIFMLYMLTGNDQAGRALKAYARNISARIGPAFDVVDYGLEAYARLLQGLANLNLVDDETARKLDMNSILSLYQMRTAYWLVTAPDKIGTRHEMSGTLAYLMFCTDLQHNMSPETDKAVRQFISDQYKGAYSYYKHITECSFASNDDAGDASQSDMTSLFQFALGYGETSGFENGLAMEGIKKMTATVDNFGFGVGAGTYEDAYPEGATKARMRNGAPLYYGAFYFRDGRLKWLVQNRAGLGWGSWFGRNPFGLHMYATGNTLAPVKPDVEFDTMRIKPRPVCTENYEPTPGFPRAKLFDKAVIRIGSSIDDAFLCFQGLGGDTWTSTPMTLLRYVEKGQLWLATNCQLAENYWRNSFVVSDGFGGQPGDNAPRLDACAANGQYGFFSGTMRNVRGGQWNRWLVRANGRFAVLVDSFQAGKDGRYALAQTFKTPVPAQLDGHTLTADKAGWRFRIRGQPAYVASVDHGFSRMDAQRFWYLRQTKDADLARDQTSSMISVMAVRAHDHQAWPEAWELTTNAVVVADGNDVYLLGRGPFRDETIQTDAELFAVAGDGIRCVGGTVLAVGLDKQALAGDTAGIVEVPHDFRDYLEKVRQAAQSRRAPVPPANRARGLSVVKTVDRDFGLCLKAVRGYTVSPQPAEAHALDDNVVSVVNDGDSAVMLEKDQPVVVDLGATNRVTRIEVCTGSVKSDGIPIRRDPVAIKVEAANDAALKDASAIKVSAAFAPDMQELTKTYPWQVNRDVYTLEPVPARYLRLTGLGQKVCELTFYSDERVPAGVQRIRAVNLNGAKPSITKLLRQAAEWIGVIAPKGAQPRELLVETLNRALTAFDASGGKLFAIDLPYDIIDFVADDLDGDGRTEIFVACFDQRLYKFDDQGRQIKASAPLFQHPYTIRSARTKDPRRKVLAVSYYNDGQFFDADLQALCAPVKLPFMWIESAGVFDVDGDGVDDLVTTDLTANGGCLNGATFKCPSPGWNGKATRGIAAGIWPWGPIVAQARPVLYAGASAILVRKVSSVSADKEAGTNYWTAADGSVFADAKPVDLDGDGTEELIAAKAVGHLVVFDHAGKMLRTIHCPGILHCVETMTVGKKVFVLVGTSAGLRVFDSDFREAAFLPGDVTHLAAAGETFWVVNNANLQIVKLNRAAVPGRTARPER